MFRIPFLFILSLTLLAQTGLSQDQFVCPSSESIAPCSCTFHPTYGESLSCYGDQVKENDIANLFRLTHISNGLSASDILTLAEFDISGTTLTTLNMSEFANTRLWNLRLSQNHQLSQFVGQEQIAIGSLEVQNSPLTDAAVADLIRFMIPTYLTGRFQFHWTQLTAAGSLETGETFQGLSAFTQLQSISLHYSPIKRLGGGQFRKHELLYTIVLDNNEIEEIGPDAFLLDPPIPGMNIRIWIFLAGNYLRDSSFSPKSGLDKIGRPVDLDLTGNYFEFISEDNFLPFLTANTGNRLLLSGNQFFCNQTMKWLKDRKDDFEQRVDGIDCVNDPGQTIFTTDLV